MIKLILWPFIIVWSFVGLIFKFLGCMISALLSVVLIIAGIVLTVTVIGAFVGVPLIIGGALLLIHSIFG